MEIYVAKHNSNMSGGPLIRGFFQLSAVHSSPWLTYVCSVSVMYMFIIYIYRSTREEEGESQYENTVIRTYHSVEHKFSQLKHHSILSYWDYTNDKPFSPTWLANQILLIWGRFCYWFWQQHGYQCSTYVLMTLCKSAHVVSQLIHIGIKQLQSILYTYKCYHICILIQSYYN